jgi:hypothetical protein
MPGAPTEHAHSFGGRGSPNQTLQPPFAVAQPPPHPTPTLTPGQQDHPRVARLRGVRQRRGGGRLCCSDYGQRRLPALADGPGRGECEQGRGLPPTRRFAQGGGGVGVAPGLHACVRAFKSGCIAPRPILLPSQITRLGCGPLLEIQLELVAPEVLWSPELGSSGGERWAAPDPRQGPHSFGGPRACDRALQAYLCCCKTHHRRLPFLVPTHASRIIPWRARPHHSLAGRLPGRRLPGQAAGRGGGQLRH